MTTSFDETMQNGRLESGAIAIHDDMSDEELEKLLQMSFEDDAQGSQRQTSTKNKTAKTVTKQTKAVADADVTIAKKTEADTAKKRPFDTEFDTKSEPMPQSKDAPVTATTTTADASTGTTKIIINNETHEGTDLNNKHDAKLKAEPIEKPHKTIINTAIDHTKYQSTPTTHTVNEKQNTANASKPKNESAELTVNSAFSSERRIPQQKPSYAKSNVYLMLAVKKMSLYLTMTSCICDARHKSTPQRKFPLKRQLSKPAKDKQQIQVP